MIDRRTLGRAGGALALSGLVGTGFTRSARAQTPIKIRSAYIPAVTWLPAWVAQDNGYFAAQGLDVSFIVVQNIGPLPNVVGKQLDIAPATVVDMIKAASGGLTGVAICGNHMDTSADAPNSVMAGKNSGIKTIKDLAGKTIGTTGVGSILHIALLYWLKKEGVDIHSIRAVEVPFPNMGDQLAAGRLDAAESVQPFVDRLKAAGNISLGDQLLQVGDPVISTVWVADRSWAAANPEAVTKWIAALKQAGDFIKANPAAARNIAAKYTHLPTAVVEKLPFPDFNLALQPSELEVWINVLKDLNQLQRPVDASKLVFTAKT